MTTHPLNRGPSPHGWHTWSPYLECPKRAAQLAGASRGGPTKPALLAGLIYHAFQEIYRSTGNRAIDTTTIEFSHSEGVAPDALRSARLIAERAFRIYRTKFPPDYFGKVLGTEVSIAGVLPHIGKATARLDLLVQVKHASWGECRRRLVSPLPLKGIRVRGEWAVDYKLEAGTQDPMRYAYKETRPDFPLVILPSVWLKAQQPVLT